MNYKYLRISSLIPSYFESAKPPKAIELYEKFVSAVKQSGIKNVQTGEFGADMEVTLCNDGPITITMDSEILLRK